MDVIFICFWFASSQDYRMWEPWEQWDQEMIVLVSQVYIEKGVSISILCRDFISTWLSIGLLGLNHLKRILS